MHKAQSYQFIQVSNSEQLLLPHDVPAVTATLIAMLSLHCCYTEHDTSWQISDLFSRVQQGLHTSLATLIFKLLHQISSVQVMTSMEFQNSI